MVARNIGEYTGVPVIETEEIVVETPTLSFDDYLSCRVFHLLLTIFHYEGNFEEAFEFARRAGIEPFDLIVALQERLDSAPSRIKETISHFVLESQEELFDTREECEAWSVAHFDELLNGDLGGNLLSKYSMIGRFLTTREALDFLEGTIASMLEEREQTPAGSEALSSVIGYLRSVMLYSPFAESLTDAPTWETWHDVEAWRDDGYTQELDAYRLSEPRAFGTTVPDDRRTAIERRIETFGDHPAGLGKFTRTMFANDLRRSLRPSRPKRSGVHARD